MNVLSLFDGIACARVALDKANIKVEKYFASEVDKNAMKIAQRKWKDIWEVGSVLGLLESRWVDEPIDLLIGGSPCQDLSIAKKGREGLAGKRSGLFYEYIRILEVFKPKWFVLENVNSMPKEAKEEISRLTGVEPIMINASLVSAQNRKRLFWTNIPNVTQPKDRKIFLKDILEDGVPLNKYGVEIPKSKTIRTSGKSSGVDDRHNWDTIRIGSFNAGGQGSRIYSTEGKSVALNAMGGGMGAKTGLYMVSGAAEQVIGRKAKSDGSYERQIEIRHDGKANAITSVEGRNKVAFAVASRGRNLVNGKRKDVLHAKTEQRIEVGGEKANTITSVFKDSMVATQNVVRKLTPIECERLQGLPDNYTEGISDSARYKACGNAFNADVIAHILSFIPKNC